MGRPLLHDYYRVSFFFRPVFAILLHFPPIFSAKNKKKGQETNHCRKKIFVVNSSAMKIYKWRTAKSFIVIFVTTKLFVGCLEKKQ